MAERKRNMTAEVGYRAHLALSAMSDDVQVTAWADGRVFGGRLRAVSNDYASRLRPEAGASSLVLHFHDGSSIPLEQVTRLERAAS